MVTFFTLFLVGKSAAQTEQVVNEMGINEAQTGQLLFKTDKPGVYQPSLMLDTELMYQVSGLIAHATVKQQFKNDSASYVEGVYVFPLPETAAVNHMKMRIGERVIFGKIKEKQQARKMYQQAKAQGQKTSLLEQQRANMFTSKVANIAPGELVTVEIEYIQSVAYRDETFSLRFPMTITPRYNPGRAIEENETEFAIGEVSWGVNTDQVPDASEITPFLDPVAASAGHKVNPISIRAEIDAGVELVDVSSRYHSIHVANKKGVSVVSLSDGQVSMDQDFVLQWVPKLGKSPKVAVFSEHIAGEDFALLMMMPPATKTIDKALPKEVIYIVDSSGSMGGVSMEQAKSSLLLALEKLKPGDRFNIIDFDDATRPLHVSAIDVSDTAIDFAKRWVNQLRASGGTNMYPALQYALQEQPDESYVRQIVFITDGAVGNEQALFSLIHNNLGANRLFTVGIGSAPNNHFMRDAAKFGRGSHTHIGSTAEVSEKMSLLFSKLENPIATNLTVNWPDSSVEVYPQRMPDLYLGEPLLVAAKLKDLRGQIIVEGQTADQNWARKLNIKTVSANEGVATLWAREKIAYLMDEIVKGKAEEAVKPQIVATALQHKLLSKYTSFVAVEEVVSRPDNEHLKTKAVANARPKGQSPQHFAYPKTAAGVTESLSFGLALMFFSLILSITGRMENSLLAKQEGKYGE